MNDILSPHGQHEIKLLEDAENPKDRIYRIHDRYEASQFIGLLGEELDQLLRWWKSERERKWITTTAANNHEPRDAMRDVQLTTGERLAEPEERDDGVMTDAGLIPWDLVEGFWNFHRPTGRWMFIPL